MTRQRGQHFWLAAVFLALVPLLMVLGNSALIPVLPQMQKSLHVSKLQVSLLITLFSIPAGITIPLAGFLADRVSRKWIVVPSLVLFGLGGVAAGLVAWWIHRAYALILAARVIQGIGAAGTAPIAMAWMADLYDGANRGKALGLNEACNAFGKVLSPIIGAAIALIAWFAVFWIFPVLCAPVAVLIWRRVPDARPDHPLAFREYFHALVKTARKDGHWLAVAYFSGSVVLFNLFGVLFYLSDILETKYHIDGIPKGLVLAVPLLALSSSALLTGILIKERFALMKWFLVGGALFLSGNLFASIWLSSNIWLFVTIMAFAAIGAGVTLPTLNMMITSAVKLEQRGIVTSLYGSVRFFGVALGPPLYTWLLGFSSTTLFVTVSALSFLCALLCLFFIQAKSDNGSPARGSSGYAPRRGAYGKGPI